MFNSPILDFSISLIFLFLLFSLFTSWILQAITDRFNTRGKFLKKMLNNLLGGNEKVNWTSRLYSHPNIESLSTKYKRVTSYIPEETFAEVMQDLIVEEGREWTMKQDKKTGKYVYKETKSKSENAYAKDLVKGLDNMPDGDLKRTLHMFWDQSGKKAEKFKEALTKWYKDYMVQVNIEYGKRIKKPLIYLGVGIALILNIDFFHVSQRLWVDANFRDQIVLAATDMVERYERAEDIETSKEFFKDYENSLQLPIGWQEVVLKTEISQEEYYGMDIFQRINEVVCYYCTADAWWWLILVKLFGFIASGFIVSFGAPFWFDLLKKVISFKKSVTSKS